ncbi:FMN-dependent NADH-azoreductase [Neptunicella marina]|uniref:FMN dependent NADH:quinone oxidoreductase n=1 Tax=Neptunicella marina TaxID=2125989 RepID=A0A8J6IS30_9ALTE|nr:NAD(P)H-dependent oxidoreductase [Neptunicella marina]MBC3764383.1 NAD(P)H-dependent oxidoreductase [Neptunicella marina]
MKSSLLYIQSSIFGDNGVSTGIARNLIQKLTENGDVNVVERNVANGEIPHFSMDTIAAIGEGNAKLADTLIKEVQDADTLVLAVPMYNFAIPTQLKSWFDHIARAGVTFKYTESGAVGLLTNKKVYIVIARGGVHKDQGTDLDKSYLTTIFGFLGITDIEFIYAEGVNLGDETRQQSIEQANREALAIAS